MVKTIKASDILFQACLALKGIGEKSGIEVSIKQIYNSKPLLTEAAYIAGALAHLLDKVSGQTIEVMED